MDWSETIANIASAFLSIVSAIYFIDKMRHGHKEKKRKRRK